ARISGRPVKLVMTYAEELIAGNPRHPTQVVVRLGCDASGDFTALAMDVHMNGGAYAGFKRLPGALATFATAADAYGIPVQSVVARLAYTNTVPRGPMRAPGGPQATFALESAIDELALLAGFDPVDLRLRNLRAAGDPDHRGTTPPDVRAGEALRALTSAYVPVAAPEGWQTGRGVAVAIHRSYWAPASLRMAPVDGGVRVETSVPENGSGLHEVVHKSVVDALGLSPAAVELRQVSTSDLPTGVRVTGSQFTATMVRAVDEC